MPTFKLTAIEAHRSHDSWERTYTTGPCWLSARTDDMARAMVAMRTMKAGNVVRGKPISPSPWQRNDLTDCVVDKPSFPVPEGEVILANGKPFS